MTRHVGTWIGSRISLRLIVMMTPRFLACTLDEYCSSLVCGTLEDFQVWQERLVVSILRLTTFPFTCQLLAHCSVYRSISRFLFSTQIHVHII